MLEPVNPKFTEYDHFVTQFPPCPSEPCVSEPDSFLISLSSLSSSYGTILLEKKKRVYSHNPVLPSALREQ